MSKERLDDIVDGLLNNRLELTSFVSESLEQAERVQELEKRLKIYQKRSWFEDYEKVAKQNKRYREVLEKVRQNMIGHYGLGGERDTYVRWSKELIDRTLEGEE